MTQQPPDDDSNSNAMVRERFDGSELTRQHETASTAIAAAAKAAIEARYILALRRPRNIATVRIQLLKECERPGFAEAAIYRKPVGKKRNPDTGEWEQQYIEGLSVRFAESALRIMTNIYRSSKVIYDDDSKQILTISVMDLESNSTVEDDITVTKTVERRELKKGQKPIAMRANSYGETVYIVPATDDEVMNKVNALKSKTRRNGMLELVPPDILADCDAKCRATMANADAKDPDAARKKVFDNFAGIGVMPDQLLSYLGLDADAPILPAQMRELRGIFSAIQDGETTWNAIVEAKAPVGEGEKKTAAAKKVEEVLKNHTAKANTPTKKDGPKPADAEPKPASAESKKPADESKSTDPAADKSGTPEPGSDG